MTKSRHTLRYKRMLELLVQHRTEAKLSQSELARRLGTLQTFVWKYEAGERRLDVVELLEVTAAIGCSVTEMLDELIAIPADAR